MSPIHALIIDDDSNSIEVLDRLLMVEGISTTVVQNPLQVESMLEAANTIDVVFLDLEMPGMDGYQVFEMLTSTLGASVPIVACSVYANEMDQTRELGFHSFIGKPLDIKQFPDQLGRILNGEAVWEP